MLVFRLPRGGRRGADGLARADFAIGFCLWGGGDRGGLGWIELGWVGLSWVRKEGFFFPEVR